MNTLETLQRVAESFRPDQGAGQNRQNSGRLDLPEYLFHYGVEYTIKQNGVGVKFLLEKCLFDSSHINGEAAIIMGADGMLTYYCFHNSCQGRTWADARQIISGDASLKEFMVGGDEPEIRKPDTIGDENPHRMRFISAGALCIEPKPANWLIKGYLTKESLADLFGETESCKSFAALDIGAAIATGTDWHGCAVHNGGPVFVIVGEGFSGFSKRIRAWEIARGISLAAAPLFISDRAARVLDKDGTEEIWAAVDALTEQHDDPVLVIIDTLNRNFGTGDENSTSDMTRFVAAMDELKNKYRCCVLIIHHSGLSDKERGRGASSLRAALDWEYKMEKDPDGSRTLVCTKSKDFEHPPEITFRPTEVDLDWVDEEGEQMHSLVMDKIESSSAFRGKPLTGANRIALDTLTQAIRDTGDIKVHVDVWREYAYEAGISPTPTDEAKRKAFQRSINKLRDLGQIDTRNDFWWPTTDSRTKYGQSPDSPRTDKDTPLRGVRCPDVQNRNRDEN